MFDDNYFRKATVTYIVDGDTFDAQVDLGFHVSISQRFRIKGIDAPELHTSTKIAGQHSKDFLANLILDKEILIHSIKTDGFRRYLADVYITVNGIQKDVAKLMVAKGHAVPYQ